MKKFPGLKAAVIAFVFGCPVLSLPSVAADAGQNYRVLSTDLVDSCAAMNAAVMLAQEDDNWSPLFAFSMYTMGYVTAVNRFAFDAYDVAGGKNPKNLLLWLERYCEEHPGKSFDEALTQMVAELYPSRRVGAPM